MWLNWTRANWEPTSPNPNVDGNWEPTSPNPNVDGELTWFEQGGLLKQWLIGWFVNGHFIVFVPASKYKANEWLFWSTWLAKTLNRFSSVVKCSAFLWYEASGLTRRDIEAKWPPVAWFSSSLWCNSISCMQVSSWTMCCNWKENRTLRNHFLTNLTGFSKPSFK